MYTRCPQCKTVFRLDPAQLDIAAGQVRCGRCRAIFDGAAHQVDYPPALGAQTVPGVNGGSHDQRVPTGDEAAPATEETTPSFSPDAARPPLHEASSEARTEDAPAGEAQGNEDTPFVPQPQDRPVTTQTAGEGTPQQPDLAFVGTPSDRPLETDELVGSGLDAVVPMESEEAENEPSEAQAGGRDEKTRLSAEELPFILADGEERSTGGILATVGRFVLSLVLVALLAGQYAYANRDELARQSELRPWLEHLCRAVGCTLPPRRDLAAFQVLERDVRFHPLYRKALLISASFVNRAPFPQPYPDLEVTLKDMAGQVVARRDFRPREYLGGSHAPAEELPPQGEAPVLLEVADPGLEAVNFEFAFR